MNIRAEKRIGSVFGKLTITAIKRNGKRTFCDIHCACGVTINTVRLDSVVTKGGMTDCGCVKANTPTHCGVGYIGVGVHTSTNETGGHTKKYCTWSDMISRCYSKLDRYELIAYADVIVCEEWLNFQTFGDWFEQNYIEGYSLDKDLRVLDSNVYSPDTCTFVPLRVNSFITSGLKLGATYVSKTGKWRAQCAFSEGGKRVNNYLGTFDDKTCAVGAYKIFKVEMLDRLQEEYPYIIDDNIYDNILSIIKSL